MKAIINLPGCFDQFPKWNFHCLPQLYRCLQPYFLKKLKVQLKFTKRKNTTPKQSSRKARFKRRTLNEKHTGQLQQYCKPD